MIYDFMITILTPFGLEILPFNTLVTSMSGATNWFNLLCPDILISWLFYVSFAYGMLYICFILPFRLFKHLIKAPDKKGKVTK